MHGGRIERRWVFMLDEPKLNILLLPFLASNNNYFIEFWRRVNVIPFLVCLEYKKTLQIIAIISVVVTVGLISFSNGHT